jgi:gamma-glutamylcyclotransferase (GGCT)/AIG2-like uncharacterized protein YtfP
LQRGECREKYWPHPATNIEPGIVNGTLYDLGPYPALVEGSDRIAGELWHIAPEHITHTVAVLDQVEDAAVGQSGLYVRRVIECETASGRKQAYAYFYAQPDAILNFPRVVADGDGVCRWRSQDDTVTG